MAVEEPLATATEAGVVRAALLSERATERPEGAAWERVTCRWPKHRRQPSWGSTAPGNGHVTGAETVMAVVAEDPLREALIVTDWLEVTAAAETVKVAVEEPLATATEAGAVSAALLSERATESGGGSRLGEGDGAGGRSVGGNRRGGALHLGNGNDGAETVMAVVAEDPLREALIVTDWLEVTAAAETVKVAVEEPLATATEAGVVSAALLSERATERPEGAAWERVTVQVAEALEATVVGEHCTLVTVTDGAETVMAVLAEDPLREALIVTDWLEVTAAAETVKVAVEEPLATATEAGVVSAALLSERATERAEGAAWERVTVQVAEALEATVAGLHDSVRIVVRVTPPDPPLVSVFMSL